MERIELTEDPELGLHTTSNEPEPVKAVTY
jgi:hypothetical protein